MDFVSYDTKIYSWITNFYHYSVLNPQMVECLAMVLIL